MFCKQVHQSSSLFSWHRTDVRIEYKFFGRPQQFKLLRLNNVLNSIASSTNIEVVFKKQLKKAKQLIDYLLHTTDTSNNNNSLVFI